jgi:hypothetical protein
VDAARLGRDRPGVPACQAFTHGLHVAFAISAAAVFAAAVLAAIQLRHLHPDPDPAPGFPVDAGASGRSDTRSD